MRIKKILLALFACMALGAVVANAAQATVWTVEEEAFSGSETVSVEGGPWSLVGETLGVKVELTAEHVACGTTGGCTISGEGASAGTLKYTGVTVMKPAGCTAHSPGEAAGNVKTNALKDKVIMDPSNESGPVFDKFTPSSGTVLVEVDFAGAECVLAGDELPLEGSVAGQFANATEVEAVEQELTFGSTEQTTSGSALTLGGGSVVEAGIEKLKLLGSKIGKIFGLGTGVVEWKIVPEYKAGKIVYRIINGKKKCFEALVDNKAAQPPGPAWLEVNCP